MTNPDRRRLLRRALPTALGVTVWLLAGCAPGSGGTGAPTGASAPTDASAATPTPTPSPTPASAPVPAAAPAVLPTTPPLLEGAIDAVDTATVVVAGSGFTRASLRVVLSDGTDAPATALVVGARLRIWTVTGGHLALLLQ